jgi:hypothetical protein
MKMIGIKGSGLLRIAGKEIPFENRVNMNFLMAPQNLIDLQGLSGTPYKSYGLNDVPAVGFSLCSNPIDTSLSQIYNRLGFIGMDNFQTVLATPLKTVIRGAGLVTTAGTVRSGGFNMVCAEGAIGDIVPFVNIPRRRVDIRITNIASLPFSDNWVYVKSKQALYRYGRDSNEIYKIGFNLETGAIGTSATLLTNQFNFPSNTSYRNIFTDGYNRIFRYTTNSRNEIAVFDFRTDTLSVVTLSKAMPSSISSTGQAWDEYRQLHVFGDSTSTWYDLDIETGTVTEYSPPRTRLGSTWVIKEHYMIEGRSLRRPYEVADMAFTTNSTDTSKWMHSIFDKEYRILDNNGWVVLGEFNSATTPGVLTLDMYKEPETAMSMLSIPATPVDADTPFTVDYTFEVVDNR